MWFVRAIVLPALLLALGGCASLSGERLARSSLGCMRAAVEQKLPENVSDLHKHCLAAGLIARYCSVPEAYLAASGKELRDAFGRGDVSWTDWRADRAGVRCARIAASDDALAECCRSAGY